MATVAPGEVLALLGPNGSGKSTILRALAGLVAVDRGQIAIDGTIVDDPLRFLDRLPMSRFTCSGDA